VSNNFWRNILYDSSKQLVVDSFKDCEKQPELFPSLLALAEEQKSKYSQRAARIVTYSIEKRPDLFGQYINEILYFIEITHDESIKFCFLKVFTFCELPEDEEKLGLLTKIAFDATMAKVERIAVRIYAIDILYRISQLIPELKRELLYVLEKYMQDAPPAFSNRATKYMNMLKKEFGMKEEIIDY
jgi:hypothetical protein